MRIQQMRTKAMTSPDHSAAVAVVDAHALVEDLLGPPPGKFLRTLHGRTHYKLEGPAASPLVILQHGIASDLRVLDDVAAALLRQGKRVLRYDFYDRGHSTTDALKYPVGKGYQHALRYTLDLHVEQMREVLQGLGFDATDFVHVGHSTGGLVGMSYAARYPERVKGLVLMDTVCLPLLKARAVQLLTDLPILGYWLVHFFAVAAFCLFARMDFHDPRRAAPFLQTIECSARENKRYMAAIRSTNSHCLGFAGKSAEPIFRKCCQHNSFPIHLIWGKADASVPYTDCVKLHTIAKEMGAAITETSFDDMPHNIFLPDAKQHECITSVGAFCAQALGS